MTIGNFYEVTLFQEYRNQVLINRWHYEQTTGVGGAVGLLAGFQVQVLPAFAAIQSDDIDYTRVLVQNLNVPADNAEDTTPTPLTGSVIDTSIPLRLAVSFRSVRPDLSKRYSWKRIGGVASQFLVGDIFNTAGSQWTALSSAMAAVISGASSTWKPVQLKVVFPGGGAPGVYTKNYDIINWGVLQEPSTQDSRTLGRGI